MNYKNVTLLLLLGVIVLSACAQSRLTKKSSTKKGYITLIESTKQRVLPGAPGTAAYNEYRFVVRWENTVSPESFFWKATDGWMPCMVTQIHKRTDVVKNGDYWYTFKPISMGDISKGDTLLLMPQSGGKYAIPSEIPSEVTNTIYFKTNNSKWMSIPIKTFTKMPDLIMQ